MAEKPIIVTATDPETGETGRQELAPGQYVVVCAEPMYVAHETVHRSGTVQLTLKRRPGSPEPAPAGGEEPS